MSEPKGQLVVVIAGATASGKSATAMNLAELQSCAIVCADARQVFRLMDIGTAKPSKQDQAKVRHYCIDIRNPDESYTAAEYARDARNAISEISESTLPMFVGGSGLYVSAAIDGFSHDVVATEPEMRRRVQEEFDQHSLEEMFSKLNALDPVAALRYSDRNPRRIQRALEFIYTTGRSFSSSWEAVRDSANYNVIHVAISRERSVLHQLINDRCDEMWSAGLLAETENLLKMGVDQNAQALQTVGYRQAIGYLTGQLSEPDALEQMKSATRQYAKRQITWLKRDNRYVWIDGSPDEAASTVDLMIQKNRKNS